MVGNQPIGAVGCLEASLSNSQWFDHRKVRNELLNRQDQRSSGMSGLLGEPRLDVLIFYKL